MHAATALVLLGLVEAALCQESKWLPVPGGHNLHIEVHGNESGPPLLYFHGGWGPLTHDLDIVPAAFRIVYFHQRGWGLSEPQGSVENNTYDDVVDDAELVRSFLGIHERWTVFGGSNGATLALKYAARFPNHVAGVVMRGYWAMTPPQVSWDYLGVGKRTLYPDEWSRLCSTVDCAGSDLLERYHLRLAGPAGDDGCAGGTPPASCSLACAWLRWDALGSVITMVPNNICAHGDNPEWYQLHPLAASRLGVHFYRMSHKVPDLVELFASGVPVHFVNGRFDLLCPSAFAHEMVQEAMKAGVQSWKATIVEHAAHSGSDPGMTAALQSALTEMMVGQTSEVTV